MGAPTGYPDWQRVSNWDGPVLVEQINLQINAPFTTPVLDVSRYAAIAGQLFADTNMATVTFTWFMDSAGTVQIGQVKVPIDAAILTPMAIRIPSLGPYVQIKITQLGAAVPFIAITLFATNRAHPAFVTPLQPQLIAVNAQAINTGTTLTLTPAGYAAGPMRVHILTSGPLMSAILNALDLVGVYQLADQEVMATNVLSYTTIAPLGAWQLQIQNNSGTNGSVWVHVTPSVTGSS